jgi:hypothetical protein
VALEPSITIPVNRTHTRQYRDLSPMRKSVAYALSEPLQGRIIAAQMRARVNLYLVLLCCVVTHGSILRRIFQYRNYISRRRERGLLRKYLRVNVSFSAPIKKELRNSLRSRLFGQFGHFRESPKAHVEQYARAHERSFGRTWTGSAKRMGF